MSHDQNFKNLILDYPREALRFFAPEEAATLDDTVCITPIRQEQLQERLGERFRELDVPLLVEWPDGRRGALVFAVEEESDSRRFSIHRLAHYCLDLAELLGTDRIVPVVIFLRGGHYQQTLKLGGDHHSYMEFSYLICDLPALSSEAYWTSDNVVARLNLPNMRYAPADRVEVYAHAVQGLFGLEPDPEKQLKYLDFIDIYVGMTEHELEEYGRRYPEEVKRVSSFAERFTEQGLRQGLQQGLQQGVRQGVQQGLQIGEAKVLLRQIDRKYGAQLAAAYRERIESADAETLLLWSDRILSAERIEDLFH